MKQKTLAIMLLFVIVGVAACGILVYSVIVPELGKDLASQGNGEFAYLYKPWLYFILGTAVPVAAALVISVVIAINIMKNRSFCRTNARLMGVISILAAADTAYFFIGNVVFLLRNMSHPGVMIFSMITCIAGAVVTVVAAALSHYAYKAAELKEQCDLTI